MYTVHVYDIGVRLLSLHSGSDHTSLFIPLFVAGMAVSLILSFSLRFLQYSVEVSVIIFSVIITLCSRPVCTDITTSQHQKASQAYST